jgi:hypothetical protein
MNARMMVLVIGLMAVSGCSHLIQEQAPNDSTTRVLNEMKSAPRIVASTPAKTDNGDSRLAASQTENASNWLMRWRLSRSSALT